MTAPNLSYYAYALVTLKSLADASTVTFKLSNRPILDSSADYISILKAINALGAELTDFSVSDFTGSIVIDDEIGSFGVERKFSDLLQRYTIIDQPIEIFTALTTPTDFAPASFTSRFKGYVSNATRGNGKISINVEARLFKRTRIGKKISDSEFSTAPDSSIGKTLPVVMGFLANEVEAVPIAEVSDEEVWLGYAATFSEQFQPLSGPSKYKTKSLSGEWAEIISATSSSYYYQQSDSAGIYNLSDGAENARKIPSYAAPGIIATGGRLQCHGWNNAGAAVTGFIQIKIYTSMPGGTIPNLSQVVAQATIKMSNYAADFKANSNFYVDYSFDRPLPMTDSESYWFSVEYAQNGSFSQLQLVVSSALYAGTINYGYKGPSGAPWYFSTTQYNFTYGLLGINFAGPTNTGTTDENGFSTMYMSATQSAAGIGQTVPRIADLPFVFSALGNYDDGSGTITSFAGDPIRQLDHIFKMLTCEYEKPDWTPSTRWDFSTFSSLFSSVTPTKYETLAYPKREIAGNTTGSDDLETLLIDLARNFHARITLLNSGKLALWPWGTSGAVVASIGQDDLKIDSFAYGAASTVINVLRLLYSKNLSNITDTAIFKADQVPNYGAVLIAERGASAILDLLIGQSEALFGKRRLANELFNYLYDSISAEVVGNSILARWNQPTAIVRASVPLYKYEALQNLDIVEVITPNLPSYYGSAPVHGPTTYDGIERPPSEYDTPRAETYRAQIEGRRMSWNDSQGPSLDLTLRLLLNYPKDPT